GIPGADLHIIYVRGGGYAIELIQYVGAPGVKIDTATNNVGSAHVAYNVSGLREMYETLRAKGVRFMSPPVDIPDGSNKGGLVVYLEDPDGNTFEFIEPPAR
ncbi:MAG: VOC family protein, partial [bacterium]